MISRMREEHIDRVVDLHLRELPWTLNARLGRAHLRRLYAACLASQASVCLVCGEGSRLVGFATAATDLAVVDRDVMRSFSLLAKARAAVFVLLRPELFGWYLDSIRLKRLRRSEHVPYLLTIGVDSTSARKGIGTAMLQSVLDELVSAGENAIYVDFSKTNDRAASFYRSRGFEHVASSRKSELRVRHLSASPGVH